MSNKLFTICPLEDGGFVAEINSAELSGVPGLPGFKIEDSCEIRLMNRATKIVIETLHPKDPVTRQLVQKARQQALFASNN